MAALTTRGLRAATPRGLRGWGVLSVLAALALQACAPGARPTAPTLLRPGAAETGHASWYGRPHHGRMTASGERYDMHALTAAHPTLPFGTRLRVVNLANDREVELRVNDRGPWIRGRILDLSYAAARALGALQAGVIRVRVTILEVAGESLSVPCPRASRRCGSTSR